MSAAVYIALRNDGLPGLGSIDNPFNGSIYTDLDSLMAGIGPDTTVYFGPGTFQTRGFGGTAPGGWTVKSGQRLIGAGMYATTLQLVKGAGQDAFIAVIQGTNVTNIEVSDMTLDANLARQPKLGTPASPINPAIKADGIGLYSASNVRVSRVRVINWGTYSPIREGFPIYIAGPITGSALRNVIEDCIIEQPELSPRRECTMLNVHADYRAPSVFCTSRNNYVNGEFTTGSIPDPVGLTNLSGEVPIGYNGTTGVVTVKTLWPHRVQAGDKVNLAGASVGAYNGRWAVATADDNRTFTFVAMGLPQPPPSNAGMTAQRYVPPALKITNLTTTISGGIVTVQITTAAPHLRQGGEYIRVSGIKVGTSGEDNPLNGSFSVVGVGTNTLQYRYTGSLPGSTPDISAAWLDRWRSQPIVIDSLSWSGGVATLNSAMPHFKAPGDWVEVSGTASGYDGYKRVLSVPNSRQLTFEQPTAPGTPSYVGAWIPQRFQGLSATAGYGGRLYGNRVIDVYTGGPYHDLSTGANTPEKDVITWNSFYYFVYVGPFSNVQVASGTDDYRQWWNITFSNVIDLQPWAKNTWNQSGPGGILYWGPYAKSPTPPLTSHFPSFDTNLIRDNVIRFVDGQQGPPPQSGAGYGQFGVDSASTKHLVVEDNVVTFASYSQPPLSYYEVDYKPERNNIAADGTNLPLTSRSRTMPA